MKIQKTKMVDNCRINDRAKNYESGQAKFLTTYQGLSINDDRNLFKSVDSGLKVLEDINIHKEISHFDHERFPEQTVKKMVSGEFWIFRIE